MELEFHILEFHWEFFSYFLRTLILYELFFLAYAFFCCLLLFIVGYMFSKIKVTHWRRQLYIEKKVAH